MKRTFRRIGLAFALVLLVSAPATAEFMLQLGSFKVRENAQNLLKDLDLPGNKGFIQKQASQDPERPWFKVRIGPFDTREAAQTYKQGMVSRGYQGDAVLLKDDAASLDEATAKAELGSEPSDPQKIAPAASQKKQPDSRPEAKAETNPEPPTSEPQTPGTSPKDSSSQREEATAQKADESAPSGNAGQEDSAKERKPSSSEDTREVTLNWEPSTEPGIAGYRIHYDTRPGPPYKPAEEDWVDEGPSPLSVDKDVTQITLHGLEKEKSYYFSITAYDEDSGMESGYSQEVIARPKRMAEKSAKTDEAVGDADVTPAEGASRQEGLAASRPSPEDGLVPDVPFEDLPEEKPVPGGAWRLNPVCRSHRPRSPKQAGVQWLGRKPLPRRRTDLRASRQAMSWQLRCPARER